MRNLQPCAALQADGVDDLVIPSPPSASCTTFGPFVVPTRNLCRVVCNVDHLTQFFQALGDGKRVTLSGWPTDARVVAVHEEHLCNGLSFVVESREFGSVEPGQVIPIWDPEWAVEQ